LLVHAAYDLSLTRATDIWRVNVDGTRRLLDAARTAGTDRTIVLSSMSAYDGTRQLYGRAKLDIEAMTHEAGGCAVRPGLVYGDDSGGMAGTLRKLSALPAVPVIAGGSGLYTVHERDLTAAVAALAEADVLPNDTVSVAHPAAVSIRDILRIFAEQEGRRCRFVPVPWQVVYATLRTAEAARVRMPFRADSLLGLVRGAPAVVNPEPVTHLGVSIRPFTEQLAGPTPADRPQR
jgi:nucleoside-diphosphate-sugar epimerase